MRRTAAVIDDRLYVLLGPSTFELHGDVCDETQVRRKLIDQFGRFVDVLMCGHVVLTRDRG